MSVINQVLNDLEKRGTNALPEVTGIRPVKFRRNFTVWLLMATGLAGLVAAAVWWSQREDAESAAPVSPVVAPIVAVPQAAMILPAEAPASIEGPAAPAMRLSMELSTIPPPPVAREKPSVAKSTVNTPPKKTVATMSSAQTDNSTSPAAPIKQVSVQQKLENDFRRATMLLRQGRSDDAYEAYQSVLQRDSGHEEARQAMVGILLEGRRNTEAEQLLQEGLQRDIRNGGFAMLLARLQVERGALPQAVEVLRKTLPYAAGNADYQAFIAALLQRQNSHQEAVEHYGVAVRLAPGSGVWLMGMGISLQALQRDKDAADAFRRALESGALSDELRAFVNQRLKELG